MEASDGENNKNISKQLDFTLNQLEINDDFFIQIVNNISSVILVINQNRLIFVNQKIYELTGYSPNEIYKINIAELIYPADRRRIFYRHKQSVTHKIPQKEFTARIFHRNNEIRWIQIKINVLSFGIHSGLLYSVNDITEFKMAEEAINTNLNFMNTLIDTLPNPLFFKNLKGDYIGCNSSFVDFLGIPKESIVGRTVFDIIPKNFAEELHKVNIQLLKNKKLTHETKVPHADGTLHDVIIYYSLFYNTDNVVGGMVGLIIDITERRVHELALEKSEQRYRLVAENTSDVIWVTDFHLHTHYVSPSVEKVLGYNIREFYNTQFDKLITNRSIDLFWSFFNFLKTKTLLQNDVLTHYEQSLELECIKKDGKTIWLEVRLGLYRDEQGRAIGVHCVARDITSRREVVQMLKESKERAEKADRFKSIFVANMSHELRTPLNAIVGFTELLFEENNDEQEKKRYLQYIRNSCDSLLFLINEMRDNAKIEEGQIKIIKTECQINTILNELHVLFDQLIKQNGQKIDLILTTGNKNPKYTIVSDPYRIKQCMNNLIGNALKFTETGYIEFGYTIETTAKTSNLLFYVKDTGTGIPPDKISTIFDRYVQVNNSMRNERGTGLGLAITKNLIDLLGGKIWVESKIGEGTTFYFTIPNIEIPLFNNNDKTAMDKEIVYDWNGKTILIAEDAVMNFMLLKRMIEKTNVTILWAKNGYEAIDLMNNNKVDLILMDMQMPDLDGYESTKRIRETNTIVPIIAQTAFAMLGERERILEIGCNEYLSKPIDKNELLRKIEKLLTLNKQ